MHKSALMNDRRKTVEQLVVLTLAILVLALTGVYISMVPFFSRAEIMAIPIAIKTLVILAYELLTEHVAKFAKWKSLKAYMILNCIEPVFWLAVVVIRFMGISTRCVGSSCAVSVVIAVVAIAIVVISLHLAIIAVKQYREYKRGPSQSYEAHQYS